MANINMCLCPQCNNAGIVERRSKHGRFYGCNDFAKGCDWKATEKQMGEYIANGSVKELTQTELLEFLTAKMGA